MRIGKGHITALPGLLLVLVLALWAPTALAQQPQDCVSCGCTLPNVTGVTHTGTLAAHGPCGVTELNMNVGKWLRFYAIAGNMYTFSTCGQPLATAIYVTNAAGSFILDCDIGSCGGGRSSLSFMPPTSTTYRLYVLNGSCGNAFPDLTMMAVEMTCSVIAPPPNNLPCNATVLPITGSTCNYTSGSNISATNSAAAAPAGIGAITVPTCAGANYQGADVWFRAVVPASGLLGIQTQEASLCAGGMQLFTNPTNNCASGPAFVAIPGACTTVGMTGPLSEPAMVLDAWAAGLVPGTVVYIRYWERGANENGTFQICAYEAQRPPNDEVCAAIPLPLNTSCQPSTHTYENASSTPAPVPAPGCGNVATVNDVWFTFQVPAMVPVSGISVNTSVAAPMDLAMVWYRHVPNICDPASLQPIACSATGSYNSAPLPGLLVGGETIYVRVWAENAWIGSYNICAVINQTPQNDEPCGAIPLTLTYGCQMSNYSNVSATVTTTPGAPSCGGAANGDVWYTVVVPPNGEVNFGTSPGSMTDAAMAIYRVGSGSCATNNLNLVQIACNPGPVGQLMTSISLTNQTAGATLYVRVWRQTGVDGTFGMCAWRTDNPPGNCTYTLNLFDSMGDGWGGSFVTVCIDGANCTNYTVYGYSTTASFGVNINQTITISYTAAGGFQTQNSYTLTRLNNTVFAANSPPQTGLAFTQLVDCSPPPAPQSDCFGSMSMCTTTPQNNQVPQSGSQELHAGNRGCLAGNEHIGLWYTFTAGTAGNLAFAITPLPNHDIDFAVWGPFPAHSNLGNICPPTAQPIRCNFSGITGDTGLQVNASLPPYGAGPWSQHLTVNVGDMFLLYVDQWTSGSIYTFNINWTIPPGTPENPALSCTVPVELLSLEARPLDQWVQLDWTTATEYNSAWFGVERSLDGEKFQEIGRVGAAGDSPVPQHYQYTDRNPLEGTSFYRLHQVDNDGSAAHSHMVSVKVGASSGITVYPNPAEDVLQVELQQNVEAGTAWRMSDQSGRLVSSGRFQIREGERAGQVKVAGLDAGVYLLEVLEPAGGVAGVARFVKQ